MGQTSRAEMPGFFAIYSCGVKIVMHTYANVKGQIVIPAPVRRRLGITKGTRIHIEVDDQGQHIMLTPITPEFIHRLRGSLKGSGLVKALLEERASDREREDGRAAW